MATTPKYALPYPSLSDPNNPPADIQALATAVEAAMGLRSTGARAYASAGTSIATSGTTTIALASESYDYGNNFASNTYTVPKAGMLDVRGRVSIAASAAGQRLFCSIYVSGAEASRGADVIAQGVNSLGSVVSDVIAVNAGDLITLRATLVGGSAQSCESGTFLTYLACRLVSYA